jgi:hypothetical protein
MVFLSSPHALTGLEAVENTRNGGFGARRPKGCAGSVFSAWQLLHRLRELPGADALPALVAGEDCTRDDSWIKGNDFPLSKPCAASVR